MSRKKTVQAFNWTVFGLLVLAGLVLAGDTYGSLMNATPDELDGMQSRIENHWNQDMLVFAGILGVFTLLLVVLWKSVFPHNVPLAIIFGGFWFEFLFQVTVTGWAGLGTGRSGCGCCCRGNNDAGLCCRGEVVEIAGASVAGSFLKASVWKSCGSRGGKECLRKDPISN